MANNHIQQHIDENIADISLFYSDAKLKTVKAITYVDQIKQGITSLAWTTAHTFTYFRNSVRGDADDWLKSYLCDYPDSALTWTKFKPLFCERFNLTCITHMFISRISNISLSDFDSNIETYYRGVQNILAAEMPKYEAESIDIDANLGTHRCSSRINQRCFRKGASNVFHIWWNWHQF